MEQIGQALLSMTTAQSDGSTGAEPKSKIEPLETCDVCGQVIRLRLPRVLGGGIVPAVCKCEKARMEAEYKARQAYETKLAIQQNIRQSLMDARAQRMTFDSLTTTEENTAYIRAAKNYCDNWTDNFKNNRGLLFYGGPGRGKTTLAFCIANRLLLSGVNVKCSGVIKLIKLVQSTYDDPERGTEADIKEALERADLLILDDLGAENKTQWSNAFLYEVVDARYRAEKPTIITTNLAREQLRQHLADEYGITRIYDRLIEMLHPVPFEGTNYRIKAAADNARSYNFFQA